MKLLIVTFLLIIVFFLIERFINIALINPNSILEYKERQFYLKFAISMMMIFYVLELQERR